MTRLPACKPREVIRALERAGFFVRRIKGSHHYMQHRHDRSRITIVPYHNRDLKPGTLSRIVKTRDSPFRSSWTCCRLAARACCTEA